MLGFLDAVLVQRDRFDERLGESPRVERGRAFVGVRDTERGELGGDLIGHRRRRRRLGERAGVAAVQQHRAEVVQQAGRERVGGREADLPGDHRRRRRGRDRVAPEPVGPDLGATVEQAARGADREARAPCRSRA